MVSHHCASPGVVLSHVSGQRIEGTYRKGKGAKEKQDRQVEVEKNWDARHIANSAGSMVLADAD